MTRLRGLVLASAVLAAVLGAGTAWLWEDLEDRWWRWRTAALIGADDFARLERCEPLDWTAFAAVLLQDLEVPCDPGWFVANQAGGDRRWRWLNTEIAAVGSQRARVRLGFSAIGRGLEPQRGWLADLESGAVPAPVRSWVVERIARQELDGLWIDPRLAAEAEVRRVLLGDAAPERGFVALDRDALWPGWLSLEDREATIALLSDGVMPDPQRVAAWAQAGATGRGLPEVPKVLLNAVIAEGSRCEADPRGAECVSLQVALGRAELAVNDGEIPGEDPEDAPSVSAEPVLASAYWRVVHPEGARAEAEGSALFRSFSTWLGLAPAEARPALLLDRLARPGAEERRFGDPVNALIGRGAMPGATALAVGTAATLAGLPWSIEAAPEGVALIVGDLRVTRDGCGREVALTGARPVASPGSFALALAAFEAAESAGHTSGYGLAARLAPEHFAAPSASVAAALFRPIGPVARGALPRCQPG